MNLGSSSTLEPLRQLLDYQLGKNLIPVFIHEVINAIPKTW